MQDITVRLASENDLQAIADITNHYIRTSTCTMKEREETLDAMRERFHGRDARYPLFVAEANGEVVGWGDLTPHSERTAYRFTVHDALYVRDDMRGQGVGTALLTVLVSAARELGHHSIVAVIASSQPPSIALHHKFGFKDVAHLQQVGFKFGQWVDVVNLQLLLGRNDHDPDGRI
jgi:phosphinothricin acetyltransferase